MYRIDRVEVNGFWGTYDFAVDLYPNVTFFIGPNGTGKTTLINLIAAALLADFATLDRLPFRDLTLILSSPQFDKKPTIEVTKKRLKDRPFDLIEYNIRNRHSGPDAKFSLEENEEQFFLRRVPHPRYLLDYYRRYTSGLPAALEDIISVSWLSIHRTSLRDRSNEERTFESSVDQKLFDQSHQLIRYFSALNAQKDEEVLNFQRMVFLSLLKVPDPKGSLEEWGADDIAAYKRAMEEIFKELRIPSEQVQHDITIYFDGLARLASKLGSRKAFSLNNAEMSIFMGADKIRGLVGDWQMLGEKLKSIFAHREKFKSIVNAMLQRKQMEIDESNELVFISRSGKKLTPQMLSSGEKQLLILLSETLLQRQKPFVFIADEPELSLHVTWQEKLVSSIRELNTSAQIVVATHSPDIVGRMTDHVVRMEQVIP